MCSFGEGISMTPLQLGALVTAISNGGTLYYLQHPDARKQSPTSSPGSSAISTSRRRFPNSPTAWPERSYGTARSVRLNFNEESILGKTGTCSHAGTRFGWFASYTNTDIGRIVTVVFLQGGRPTFRPQSRGNCRAHVPQSLRPQLLRRPFRRDESGGDGRKSSATTPQQ